MRTVDQGGNDTIYAVTLVPHVHDKGLTKGAVVDYLNQIVPLAATTAGAIAISQIGFHDYVTYRQQFPKG